jgi:GTP-binding protein
MSAAIPTVVIVGRPNVGKSTLFNRITGQRRAIVGDEPGITRDRIHGTAEHDHRPFELIDTGGIVVADQEYIPAQVLRQADVALHKAAHIIFLIDGRAEITGSDRDLAQMLQRLGKPVSLAVNKIDTASRQDLTHQFYELGISDVFPVSAEHGTGVDALLDHVTADFPQRDPGAAAPDGEPGATEPTAIKVAIIGRPNVGKSTLLNALTGQERAIVSPIAGTTRDAVDETVTRDGVQYTFVDTAGIRRKGKTHAMAEKLSVVMARRNIRMAHVVLLILDATEGIVGLDTTIAGYAHEGGRALILCVNKWDEVKGHGSQKKGEFEQKIRDSFKFLEYAPVVYLSAKSGGGLQKLLPLIREVYQSASRRISTGELNRFVEQLRFEERKIYYITQHSIRPPAFAVFTGKGGPLHFSHERYLINQLRRRFGFKGTPILLQTRAKKPKTGA